MAAKPSKKAPLKRETGDVMLVYGQSDDGRSYEVLRQREGQIQAGRVTPLDEGKPIHGEVVRLKPRSEAPLLFDVEVEHDARRSVGGPAKVATDDYRKGWESIWARGRQSRTLN